jgi:DNA-binding transcriptional LysR family regulator
MPIGTDAHFAALTVDGSAITSISGTQRYRELTVDETWLRDIPSLIERSTGGVDVEIRSERGPFESERRPSQRSVLVPFRSCAPATSPFVRDGRPFHWRDGRFPIVPTVHSDCRYELTSHNPSDCEWLQPLLPISNTAERYSHAQMGLTEVDCEPGAVRQKWL